MVERRASACGGGVSVCGCGGGIPVWERGASGRFPTYRFKIKKKVTSKGGTKRTGGRDQCGR